jgi:hypothetical protein
MTQNFKEPYAVARCAILLDLAQNISRLYDIPMANVDRQIQIFPGEDNVIRIESSDKSLRDLSRRGAFELALPFLWSTAVDGHNGVKHAAP